jgi:CheY-like chemotaxis protein
MNSHVAVRVLIVDDDKEVREMFADVLTELGALAVTAASVAAARPLLETFCPAIVMTDVYMPGENGLVMRAEVRNWNPATPVVALTGADQAEVQPDAGFALVLRKPVGIETLEAMLKELGGAG